MSLNIATSYTNMIATDDVPSHAIGTFTATIDGQEKQWETSWVIDSDWGTNEHTPEQRAALALERLTKKVLEVTGCQPPTE